MTLPEGIDLEAIRAWVRTTGLGSEVTFDRQLAGGTQNIVLAVDVDGKPAVLRHPPAHPRPHSNRALQREARVLRALDATIIPHPRVLAVHDETDKPDGRTYYLMERIDGFNAATEIPPAYRADPLLVRDAGLEAARVLGRLGSLDLEELGLGDLSKPEGFLRRQIERSLAEWQKTTTTPGYDPSVLGDVDAVARWLLDHEPKATPPGLNHGDYHLSNVLLHRTKPEVLAVIDWEMCTLGDPLFDLGWMLACWPSAAPEGQRISAKALAQVPGLPTKEMAIEAYREASNRSVDHVRWYQAAAAFKLGLILEGTFTRSLVGQATVETGLQLHADTLQLLALARSFIS